MALVLAGVLQLLFGILRAGRFISPATTMVTSPAAGPLTAKREGLRAVTTRPPMMPVSRLSPQEHAP
jgi:hypothetical protein